MSELHFEPHDYGWYCYDPDGDHGALDSTGLVGEGRTQPEAERDYWEQLQADRSK